MKASQLIWADMIHFDESNQSVNLICRLSSVLWIHPNQLISHARLICKNEWFEPMNIENNINYCFLKKQELAVKCQ